MERYLGRLSPSLVISLVALFVALGGTTYAATSLPKNSVGPKQLKKNAVTAAKIKNGAVTAAKINPTGLTVPSARHATTADTATDAGHAATAGTASPSGGAGGVLAGSYPNPSFAEPEAWHEIGASGEPAFAGGWVNEAPGTSPTAAFYKDPFGNVHLKGLISSGIDDTVFTLPVGYRPGHVLVEVVRCGTCTGGTAYALIYDTGRVAVEEGAATGSETSLDGVTFRAGE
jgi:hypothetical protein